MEYEKEIMMGRKGKGENVEAGGKGQLADS